MKILVATKEKQGQRKNDFCWATEGEIVNFAFECDGESIDGKCGCRRSMSGVESLKSTTTIKVIESEKTESDIMAAIRAGLEKGGWLKLGTEKQNQEMINSNTAEVLKIAAHFPAGAVLEKRGYKFVMRK